MKKTRPNLKIDPIEVQRELCRRSLAYYAKAAWHLVEPGREYVHGWHIDSICEHLEAVTNGQIRNLLINMPPRCMKSSLVSVFWPTWVWTFRPEARWLFSSYAESLSIRDSVKCRRVIQSPWYQHRFGNTFTLTGDQNQKQKFENNKTGHRIATSVGGAGTGEGGDYIVCDDPHRAMDVRSDAMRESVLDWWDSEMSSRGNNPKTVCKVIVMQRLHEDDLSGHILEQGGYEHLCLPMEYEGDRCHSSLGWTDPRSEFNELLWPTRFGAPEVAEMKLRMGSQEAAGQLQQRPAPAEGNIIKKSWWKFYDIAPLDLHGHCIAADLTFGASETSDYTVFTVWATRGADRYLLDMVRARMTFTEQITALQNLCKKWPKASAKYIENAANGKALIDTLRTKITGLIPVQPEGSKEARAQSIAPMIEAGNVFLPKPENQPWIDDVLTEWTMFPSGRHDDIVDSMTLALRRLTSAHNFDIDLSFNNQLVRASPFFRTGLC